MKKSWMAALTDFILVLVSFALQDGHSQKKSIKHVKKHLSRVVTQLTLHKFIFTIFILVSKFYNIMIKSNL